MKNSTIAVYDIETPYITNGPKSIEDIYCIAVQVVTASEPTTLVKVFTNYEGFQGITGTLADGLALINSCDYRCGHNIVNFDDTVCTTNGAVFTNTAIDTLILTQIMYPANELYAIDIGVADMPKDMYMKYSLAAFGHRLGLHKAHFDDFSAITQEMIDYCEQDVKVTTSLLLHILASDRLPSKELIQLENTVGSIIVDLEDNGFYFDKQAARQLATKMVIEQQQIEYKLRKVFRPMYLKDSPEKNSSHVIKAKKFIPVKHFISKFQVPYKFYRHAKIRRLKNGKWRLPPKSAFKWFNVPHYFIHIKKQGTYQDIKLTKFKATDNQIIHWLTYLYNFKFSTYTQLGNVRVDRDNLEEFADELLKAAKGEQHNLTSLTERFLSLPEDKRVAEAEAISTLRRLMKIKKDYGQLAGTDNSLIAVCREDSTITTRINQNGTVTGRFTSSGGGVGTNLNQIPSSKEFRSLFTAPKYYHVDEKFSKYLS